MSPLLLAAFILKVVVAIDFDDLSPDAQAKLEAAVLAKYNVTLNDQTKQSSIINGSSQQASLDEALVEKSKREGSGLNVRKLEDSSQEASSDEALVEQPKPESSGLNVRKLEGSSQEAFSGEALPEKSTSGGSSLNVRKLEDSSQEASSDRQAGIQPEAFQETSSSEPAASSKLILKKPSNHDLQEEKKKNMEKENTDKNAKLTLRKKENNDKNAKTVFPNNENNDNDAKTVSASSLQLVLCSLSLAALSIAGYACHVHKVILEVYSRKGDNLLKRNLKAKREDDDTFTESSHFGQSTSSCVVSPVMVIDAPVYLGMTILM